MPAAWAKWHDHIGEIIVVCKFYRNFFPVHLTELVTAIGIAGLLLSALPIGGSAGAIAETLLGAAPAPANLQRLEPDTVGAHLPSTLQPSFPFPKHAYIVADSVVLGAESAIRQGLSDWRIELDGRPALTLRAATEDIRERRQSLPAVVIVAVGYNSLWEKERKNFKRWAERFDKEAEILLAEVQKRGARKVVWVLLRELTLDLVPKGHKDEFERSWYFPYVNERLKNLRERHPELVLADWATIGAQQGITYDFIHLNTKGGRLMLELLKSAIGR